MTLSLNKPGLDNKTDWTLRKVYEEDHALLEEFWRLEKEAEKLLKGLAR